MTPRARLLCLPHAGGAAVIYQGWLAHLPPDIELIAVELPGRGSRFGEPAIDDFYELIEALHSAVSALIDGTVVLFGHSLGALLAFELARRSEPRTLIVSGSPAPHRPRDNTARSRLSDDELARELASLGGTPPEVLDNAELMELMLPVLRADFAVAESYRYRHGPSLSCPILALGGDRDEEVIEDDLCAWRELTTALFRHRVFAGGHFFLRQCEREVIAWLLQEALA